MNRVNRSRISLRQTALLLLPSILLLAAARAVMAQGGPPPTPVRVDAVREEVVQERRRVTGELRPMRRARIATREPGLIIELTATEGNVVRKGDLLCRLDAERLEIAAREMEAEVEFARATESERTAEVERMQRDFEAIGIAAERGAANPKERADARSVLTAANARLDQARRTTLINEARLELWKQRIEDTRITAPFDGVVAARGAELGEWVAEGSTVLELVSTGPVEAWIDVPQEIGSRLLTLGDQVGSTTIDARLDAGGATVVLDRLRVVPVLDQRTRTYPIVSLVEAGEGRAPGMSLTAWIPTGSEAKHLTLHRDAVLRGPTGTFVYVVRGAPPGRPAGEGAAPGGSGASGTRGGAAPGGAAPPAPETVLPATIDVLFNVGDRVVVTSRDLRAGDRVVIEGNERLYPGAAVAPIVAPAR